MGRYKLSYTSDALPVGEQVEVPPFGLVQNGGESVLVEIPDDDDLETFGFSADHPSVKLESTTEGPRIEGVEVGGPMRVDALVELAAQAPDADAVRATKEEAKRAKEEAIDKAREQDRALAARIRESQAPEGGEA